MDNRESNAQTVIEILYIVSYRITYLTIFMTAEFSAMKDL